MSSGDPTFIDLVLAFRQAKKAVSTQRGSVGLLGLAHFEMQLTTRIRQLMTSTSNARWFDAIDIGQLVVMPKSASPQPSKKDDIVRIGDVASSKMNLSVRLQLEPTPEFTTVEVLYLWEFGGALEALLDESCVGYRLKRVNKDGSMNRRDLDVYEHWPSAFASYREDPIKVARGALREGKRVIVASTDVVSFFDSIDPQFLLEDTFVTELEAAALRLGRPFSRPRYTIATQSLINRFAEFRRLRRSVGGNSIDMSTGVPIGALTSRVFANVALASLDTYIKSLPDVVLYRRYVDDIVIVSTRDRNSTPPVSVEHVLTSVFPGFTKNNSVGHFVVPATKARFDLNEEKTRIHELVGTAGIDFLGAVQQSFSVVTSERRAFLGNIERLEAEIEVVNLFSNETTGSDRLPRLRDADLFTLRRFMSTAVVRGLERCALLLDAEEASAVVEQRAARILSLLTRDVHLDNFDLALSLMKVALLCNCESTVAKLKIWLKECATKELLERVSQVSWRGHKLRRVSTLRALADYLRRRVREGVASACALIPSTGAIPQSKATRRDAVLLRRSGLRHLDREDDVAVFGKLKSELIRATREEHAIARETMKNDESTREQIALIQSFIKQSNKIGERIWSNVSDIGLLLSIRPPRYADVAKRFLANAEAAQLTESVGRQIDACVDALRGTRYQSRRFPVIVPQGTNGGSSLRIGPAGEPALVRVILSNLPVGIAAFKAAASGRPMLTLERLTSLDRALRDTQRAARAARQRKLPSILVMPELSVPRRWTRALSEHAVREDLSIVAGIEYGSTGGGLLNQVMGIFPTGMQTAAIVRWTKRNPARGEEASLQGLGRKFVSGMQTMRRLIVESAHGRLGVLICSEILEASALFALSGHVELLLVPAWNDDTPSFEHVAHAAASLLVHSFICVANNAEASDSRIVAPIKEPRHERDWCRLVHRRENQVIWGDLPVAELRSVHDGAGSRDSGSATDERRRRRTYRPLPPGWRGR